MDGTYVLCSVPRNDMLEVLANHKWRRIWRYAGMPEGKKTKRIICERGELPQMKRGDDPSHRSQL